jgi:TRAP transporter 4TM/12TM fusion protein
VTDGRSPDLVTEDVGLAAFEKPRSAFWHVVVTLQGAALTLIALFWALDLHREVGMLLFTEQFLAVLLALALSLTYLTVPRTKGRVGDPPLYDIAAAALGFAAGLYVAVRYPVLMNDIVYKPIDGVVIGAILLVLVLEGVRRTCGMTLVIVVGVFIAYALWGYLLPDRFAARPIMADRLLVYSALDTNGILGTSLVVAATVVIAFIFMGQVLQRGGGADYFNDVSLVLLGRSRGGSAKITNLSSLLFGTISGSAVANTVSSGVMTIPLMKRAGYPATTAAAVEAVSSTGGQLVPPVMGAAAFLMAEYLQLPYSDIAIAAIVPALLYYLALYFWIDLDAGRMGYRPIPGDMIPSGREVMRAGWHFPIPFVFLIVALFWLNWSPELSAVIAAGILIVNGLVFGYRGKRMTVRDVIWTVTSTGAAVIDVLLICAAAGLVIGILNLTGLAFGLTLMLVQLAGENVVVLLAMAALVSIVLGMGMPTVAVYVLLATLAAPALIQSGIAPLSAHMFLLYFGMMSMITPPVALAAYAAASIAQADFWRTGLESVRMGWTAYLVPFIFAFEPGLLLGGDPWSAVWQVASAMGGVWLVTAALVGYLWRPLVGLHRAVFAVGGMAMVVPMHSFAGGVYLDLAGIGLGVALVLYELLIPESSPLSRVRKAPPA